MDALALLCNLYGDGPSTLERLRADGVKRIEDLGGRRAVDLETLLSLAPATARRFLKEASALEKRVLDSREQARKEELPKPAAAKRAARETLPKRAAVQRATRVATRGKDAMLAAAARRWDELDRSSPPHTATQPAAAASIAVDRTRGMPLAAAQLDRATHVALEAIGIRTLDELVDLDSDVLAAAASLGISQVLFVQGLARRKLRERALHADLDDATEELADYVLQPGPHSDLRFSPSERPPAQWLSAGAGDDARKLDLAHDEGAGPFA